MNAIELRDYLLEDAKRTIDEVRVRQRNSFDPLTGEAFEGSIELLMQEFKILGDVIKQAKDKIPKLPEKVDGKFTTNADKLQMIIDMMLAGEIDAAQADSMIKPTLAFMNSVELREANDKIEELNKLIESGTPSEIDKMLI